jgi:hypothetical protein
MYLFFLVWPPENSIYHVFFTLRTDFLLGLSLFIHLEEYASCFLLPAPFMQQLMSDEMSS